MERLYVRTISTDAAPPAGATRGTTKLGLAIELLLGATWALAALAKFSFPDLNGQRALATRLAVSDRLLGFALTGIAALEVCVALMLLFRWRVESALWASYIASMIALAAWVCFDSIRIGCGCFGSLSIDPIHKLLVICMLFLFSLWSIRKRVVSRRN